MTDRDHGGMDTALVSRGIRRGGLAASRATHGRGGRSTRRGARAAGALPHHTHESETVVYRDDTGRYDPDGLHRLDRFLRCHFTGQVAPIDLRVIEFLRALDQGLGGDREIHVVSGFRSSVYNNWLIRHGSGVATRSLHLEGRAIDVRFPGVPLPQVRRVALALGSGGGGYYPTSEFVHLDSGRVRCW